MKTINWAGYTWQLTERNGLQYHPTKTKMWLSPDNVSIDGNGYLHLKTKYNPKTFGEWNRPIACGLVSSIQQFSYGNFEICAKLPQGKWLWPAFWAYSSVTWPPEVDVFEGYSNKNGSYWHFLFFHWFSPWNIRTNVYYNEFDDVKNIGSKQHSQTNGDPSKRFEYYRFEWTPTSIKIFYGSKKVREITNKKIIDQFNKSKMNVIINTAVVNDATSVESMKESDFVIKYFSYKPL